MPDPLPAKRLGKGSGSARIEGRHQQRKGGQCECPKCKNVTFMFNTVYQFYCLFIPRVLKKHKKMNGRGLHRIILNKLTVSTVC